MKKFMKNVFAFCFCVALLLTSSLVNVNLGYAKETAKTEKDGETISKTVGNTEFSMNYVDKKKIRLSDETKVMTLSAERKLSARKADDSKEFLNDCSTNYAFHKLGEKRGYRVQKLYVRILSLLNDFYSSNNTDITESDFDGTKAYCIGNVNYGELNVTTEKLLETYIYVMLDHPCFYATKNDIIYDGENVFLLIHEEFKSAAVRADYNKKIREEVEAIGDIAGKKESNYDITKAVHDEVMSRVSYAYESDGKTPREDSFVHTIAGFVNDNREVVCEGYTKTVATVLNYLDIDNIIVIGWGVPETEKPTLETLHSWNLVSMGNEKYYFVDVTWDDELESNEYLCIGKQELVKSHKIAEGRFFNAGNGYMYTLPDAVSDENFSGSDTKKTVEDPTFALAFDDYETEYEYNGFIYKVNVTDTVTILRHESTEPVVNVPQYINGVPVNTLSFESFSYDKTTVELTIPDTVCFIHTGGFCEKLEKLTIYSPNPDSMLLSEDEAFSIGRVGGCFSDCKKLKTVNVIKNDNLEQYEAVDNVLYSIGKNDNGERVRTLVLYPAGKEDKTYSFDEELILDQSCFSGNEYIEEVNFLKPVIEAKTLGFSVDGPTMPSSSVFTNCTKLKTVHFTQIPRIAGNLFNGCVSLNSFVIPDGVTEIQSGAFSFCQSLTHMDIPASVKKIGSAAFQDTALRACIIRGNEVEFDTGGLEADTVFNGCKDVVIYCNSGSTAEKYAKTYDIRYDRIENYTPAEDTPVPTYTPAPTPVENTPVPTYTPAPTPVEDTPTPTYTSAPTSVPTPTAPATGGDNNNLKDQFSTLQQNKTEVVDQKTNAAFTITNPGNLVNGKLEGAEVQYIKPVKQTSKIVIPETATINGIVCKVTSIAANTFAKDKKITQVIIGSNITSIGTNAFKDCKNLKKVTLGKRVKKIGKNAFTGSKKLKTIVIQSTSLKSIGKNALKGISKKAVIQVPKKQYAKYKKLFTSKTGFKKTMKLKK